MELFKASRQWAERPNDERFWTLEEMTKACADYRATSATATVSTEALRVEAVGDDVQIVGRTGVQAGLTHWAFGQLCARSNAPAGYLRQLPATLACQNLNHGLKASEPTELSVLFHKNGALVARALTTDRYSRVWNNTVCELLQRATEGQGWKVPPARPASDDAKTRTATEEDVLRCKASNGLSINVGDVIAPAGLYASDHDMFAFMVNEEHQIDDGTGHGLNRGFFVWNSEVGAASFGVQTFLYDAVCGNHIVWGAKQVKEIRLRHVGEVGYRASHALTVELAQYADSQASDDEQAIQKARSTILGANMEDAVKAALSFATKAKVLPLNKGVLEDAYTRAQKAGRYGNPGSVWGLVNGLTEASQLTPHADVRSKLDKAAGKLMQMVF